MKKKILISFILVLMILCNIKVYATSETAELPSKYDLRNDISIKVENQENSSWCDSYANIKALETYIQKTKGLNYNLSVAYFVYWNAFGNTMGRQVLESDFPTKQYDITEESQKKFDNATPKAVVEDFEYLEGSNLDRRVEGVKKYITNYGGLIAGCNIDDQWYQYKGGIYRSKQSTGLGHKVVIIGWDDNYSKDNFVYEKPQNDGAWLVLNSWGSSWANKGTAWVSYEDYNTLINTAKGIKSVTLSTGETIETKLEEKEEIKETTASNLENVRNEAEQQALENQRKENIITIAYILVFVLFIVLIIIKIVRHKKKSIKGE